MQREPKIEYIDAIEESTASKTSRLKLTEEEKRKSEVVPRGRDLEKSLEV